MYVDDGSITLLRHLDATGTEISNINITDIVNPNNEEGMYYYIAGMIMDDEGTLYLNGNGNQNELMIISPDGTVDRIPVDNYINSIVELADGRVGAMMYKDNSPGMVLAIIDKATKAFGDEYPIPNNIYQPLRGSGDYDFYYNDQLTLNGYKLESGTSETIINWIDSDVDSSEVQQIVPLDDGRIVGMNSNYADNGVSYELVTLTKVDPATLPVKEVLNMAVMYLNYDVRAKIIEFNKKSANYRIKVTDYSVYNTDEDYTAGNTKLTTEIMSGQVPDILSVDGLPLARMIARGYLEDLTPFIENDPDLGMDALVPGAVKALTVDGGIYQAAAGFYLRTLVGDRNVVGEGSGWTIDDMNAALGNLPQGATIFNPQYTREAVMSYFINSNQGAFVDWESGTCNFDSEGFIKLIEFIKTLPADYDYASVTEYLSEETQIKEGKIMLGNMFVSDFQSYQVVDTVLEGRAVFKGYPTMDGSVGNFAQFNGGLAMSSTCQNKDAAWSFIRYMFTADGMYNEEYGYFTMGGFPVNQSVFDKLVAQAMEKQMGKDENGEDIEISIGSWGIDDRTTIEIYAATQEQIDTVKALIDNMVSEQTFDQNLYAIITEELAPFFEGQKTAAEAAAIIQSRAKIYIAEQS
jgi:ABC-type glycerol-3-phosphate transport system substrate-binding protein